MTIDSDSDDDMEEEKEEELPTEDSPLPDEDEPDDDETVDHYSIMMGFRREASSDIESDNETLGGYECVQSFSFD